MIQHPLPTARYLEKVGDTAVSAVTLPLIAIPTTAGTGSEVTQNAVVTDQRDIQIKASLRHPVFVPQVAILDPDLLKGAPDKVLAPVESTRLPIYLKPIFPARATSLRAS